MDRSLGWILLGLGVYLVYEQSQQPGASGVPGRPPATGSGSGIGGGVGGGSGSAGGSGGGPTYSPGTVQSPGSAAGQPYGPPNPLTDPCNMAGSGWNQVGCTNEGGSPYWDNGNGVSVPITATTSPNGGSTYQDSGDPCDEASVQFNPDVCAEMNGYVYNSADSGTVTNTGGSGASTGGGDSGDPCDPNSYAYDEATCAEQA